MSPEAPRKPRKRVAILGGGAAAMTAAHYMSRTPELRERLEVTVYQMGWRLGGKGASGRNLAESARIEEHGLHVWGGFYYNAFRLMQECYGALDRPPGCPLRTWTDAFQKHPLVVWEELVDGQWRHWPVETPLNDGVPGTGGEDPTLWQHLQTLIGWIKNSIFVFPHEDVRAAAAAPDTAALLHGVHAEALSTTPDGTNHHGILSGLERLRGWFHGTLQDHIWRNDEARRMYILLDLAQAVVRGMLRDGVPWRGIMCIDEHDFAEWLGRHGATSGALTSAPLRGYYDYFFAYAGGDASQPRISAAIALHHLLRLVGEYKGALFWKMGSGMGDAAFGPLYELCRRNGVRFRFFHEVKELVPDGGSRSLAAVRLRRQADLKRAEYQPLVTIAGLPSWPSAPLYAQIVDAQAAEIQRRGANLEDPLTDWDGVADVELQAGRDFDAVVLGISIGAFPQICARLIAADPAWRAMAANLPAIQTQALQLWWPGDAGSLGWDMGNATGTGYGQPLESWSDMSPVLPLETWPAGSKPGTVIYFCGIMDTPELPQRRDPGFLAGETGRADARAADWARQYLPHLYPRAGAPLARYVRANCTPSERYVLDLPGTNRYRLEADTSGLDNLALAGDWIFTGQGGAVESAITAGMLAAQALTGEDLRIRGALPSPWRRRPSLRRLL
ncbi:MAG: hypothetical protein EYC70_09535 [Planctomycetota bacterium]|nr:MAG: hypothetical protein EYC70_09535 [Planctomycetota bacterium]